MRVSFACPSCNAAGTVDAIHVGKQVRCKHCGAHFAIPDGEMPEADIYALEQTDEPVGPRHSRRPGAERGLRAGPWRNRTSSDRPRRKRQDSFGPTPQRARRDEPAFPWGTWLIRGGVAFVLILVAIALFAPHGYWLAGCILIATGGVLILVGHLAGAFGAFSEDSLYGLFYLLIPLYTAYYIVTRWDDMWVWFACSTVGVGPVDGGDRAGPLGRGRGLTWGTGPRSGPCPAASPALARTVRVTRILVCSDREDSGPDQVREAFALVGAQQRVDLLEGTDQRVADLRGALDPSFTGAGRPCRHRTNRPPRRRRIPPGPGDRQPRPGPARS